MSGEESLYKQVTKSPPMGNGDRRWLHAPEVAHIPPSKRTLWTRAQGRAGDISGLREAT
jgi:hypothetical protein